MFNGKMKAVTFSYDDGTTQDVRLVELLDKYGLKCTFNINSGVFGRAHIIKRDGRRVAHFRMPADRICEVYEGHEIAAHTLTHSSLSACSDEEIIRQVEEDRKNLSEICGYEVVGMAYPNGSSYVDERVERLIKEKTGIKYARGTTRSHSFDIPENLFHFYPTTHHLQFDELMQMGREFIEMTPAEPKLFYIWGHSFEMDYDSLNWHRLEEFFKLISGRDDIFYGTNKEVLL